MWWKERVPRKNPRQNPIINFQGTNRLLPRKLRTAKDSSVYQDVEGQGSAFLNWTYLAFYEDFYDVNLTPASYRFIYQLPVRLFVRILVPMMILILMVSVLSGCIFGEFVQSP